MIISPLAVIWFITEGKRLDRCIIDLFKLSGIDVPETDKKNIKNMVLGKHKASPTTEKNISGYFRRLISNKEAVKIIEGYSYEDMPKSYFDSVELDYSNFFRYGDLEDTFIYSQIKEILKILRDIESLMQVGAEEKSIESRLRLEVKKKIGFEIKSDLLIDISVPGAGAFSLSFLLYILACADQQVNGDYLIEKTIEKMLPDVKNAKMRTAFAYYVDLAKYFSKKVDQDIYKTLSIDKSLFYKYKNGDRSISKKHIKIIFERHCFEWITILFMRNLINSFIKNDECRKLIEENLVKYPDYLKLALLQREEYGSKKSRIFEL